VKRHVLLACALASIVGSGPALGYPLDGYEQTGILRLEAYRLAQDGKVRGRLLPPGARLPSESIVLRLVDHPDFQIPAPDTELEAAIEALLGEDADGYSLAILDLTHPSRPRYAAHNPEREQNPGSVGKLMVALGWFQTLADVYPDDTRARHELMRNTRHTADAFIRTDSHTVPFWQPGDTEIEYRPIREGDVGNLWTWLDWMASSSSNAAASTVMEQLILLRHFGAEFPVSQQVADQFFKETSKSELSDLLREAVQTPIRRNGLDVARLRQGSLFTREGKNRVPGTNSVSTPLELLRFMVKMEQGQLVDPYSSLEIKRLIYLSEGRIRYAASPDLRRSALFFKSGSLYSCKPEPGFECGKYMGNNFNFLNSVTVVETDGPGPKLHYVVVLLSNVLRKNSADIHENLATEIHRIMEGYAAFEAQADGVSGIVPAGSVESSAAGAGPVIDEIDTDEEHEFVDGAVPSAE
jgi:hypothetical protein